MESKRRGHARSPPHLRVQVFLHHVLKRQPHPVPSPIEHVGAPSHEPAAEHATLKARKREGRNGRQAAGAWRDRRTSSSKQKKKKMQRKRKRWADSSMCGESDNHDRAQRKWKNTQLALTDVRDNLQQRKLTLRKTVKEDQLET